VGIGHPLPAYPIEVGEQYHFQLAQHHPTGPPFSHHSRSLIRDANRGCWHASIQTRPLSAMVLLLLHALCQRHVGAGHSRAGTGGGAAAEKQRDIDTINLSHTGRYVASYTKGPRASTDLQFVLLSHVAGHFTDHLGSLVAPGDPNALDAGGERRTLQTRYRMIESPNVRAIFVMLLPSDTIIRPFGNTVDTALNVISCDRAQRSLHLLLRIRSPRTHRTCARVDAK
jgi:hypothetical protein